MERSEQRRPEESRRRKSEAMKAMGSGMGWPSDGAVRAIEWEVWHHSDCRKLVHQPEMIQSMVALSNVRVVVSQAKAGERAYRRSFQVD